jgi:hypothetical protein
MSPVKRFRVEADSIHRRASKGIFDADARPFSGHDPVNVGYRVGAPTALKAANALRSVQNLICAPAPPTLRLLIADTSNFEVDMP